ncbi:MAG: signal peptidase I [Clostridia bacterium]|nr:signal peptidase I [Clostridia bacterium]
MKKPYGAELFRMRRIAERRNDKLHGAEVWGAFDLLLTMLAVVVFALAIRAVLVEPVRVEGESMLDTLQNGDYLFVEKLTYAVNEPKAGDIVICYYPDAYYQFRNKDYHSRVKRVVAVAGDTVETKNGALYVNGEMVDEPYLSENRRDGDHDRGRRGLCARRQPQQFKRQPQRARRSDSARTHRRQGALHFVPV